MMNGWDWSLVVAYLAGMVGLSAWLGRHQRDPRDYYLGGNKIPFWAIGLSTMATQCSTNSLLGAPAFVIAVGGLLWLQYELAVPLAMIGLMVFFLPFFRRLRLVSIYEYLEWRLGPGSRLLLAVMFLFLRAFATGVTVYGISIVLVKLLGFPFWGAVLILGAVTVVYDFLGGMKAVVYSDVIQMAVLLVGMAFCLGYALNAVGGWSAMWAHFPAERAKVLDFRGHGLGDGKTFAFWPMLIGGFFLYLSYYGCDQTQVQRELSSRHPDDTNLSLFLNGVARFPLVLTYCLVGVAMAAFMAKHPGFEQHLFDPDLGGPNYNLAVPAFCLHFLPHGVIGLVIVALFAAAMSSLDSTINSLSAVTLRDIVGRYAPGGLSQGRARIRWARLTTVFWGVVCIGFSFFVKDIATSVIESINMISSLANGPILGTFLLAILTRRAHDRGTIVGILGGFATNGYLWLAYADTVSWLWWNVIGCAVTFGLGYGCSRLLPAGRPAPPHLDDLVFTRDARKRFGYRRAWWRYHAVLLAYFMAMVGALKLLERIAGQGN